MKTVFKLFQMLFNRSVIVACALMVQMAVLILMVLRFEAYFVYFYGFCILLSFGTVLYIIGNRSNPGYKIAWIIPILLFPIFGGLFYLMFGGNRMTKKARRVMLDIEHRLPRALLPGNTTLEKIERADLSAANQSRYLVNFAGCPPYQRTSTRYLPSGEVKFQCMLETLAKAEHYIFLEYFIIQPGKMWDPILALLTEKAAQGVDVRVIYDDVGCLMTLPYRYDRMLEARGIQCRIFNPFRPVLSARLNNRDHRKLLIVDGHTGFTGGINLADEYINAYPKHGHWKDASILLHGEAVWSMTVMFLAMWDNLTGVCEEFEPYRPDRYCAEFPQEAGFVQPYADCPLDNEPVGETVYLNLITKARQYVYIMTPYLILDNEIATALCNAAKAGVDVRIITPHVPDKWYVHMVTRAYYDSLVEEGVKIFEYTPGFVHAKVFAVDDEIGVVGSVNLDYRSLYLHFECGVWLYQDQSVLAVKEDFLATQAVSQAVTLEDCKRIGIVRRLCRSVLRAFAPLM